MAPATTAAVATGQRRGLGFGVEGTGRVLSHWFLPAVLKGGNCHELHSLDGETEASTPISLIFYPF